MYTGERRGADIRDPRSLDAQPPAGPSSYYQENSLGVISDIADQFPRVTIGVPPSVVLGADVFDELLEHNGLRDFSSTTPKKPRSIGDSSKPSCPWV